MSAVLEVRGLTKKYEKFTLDNLSFSLEKGSITGFIGRNGAGKTTTLKCLLNLVHPTAGEISYFGLPFPASEAAVKQRLGYACGSVNYYVRRRISDVAAVTSLFYDNWDAAAYDRFIRLFEIDPSKTPAELSEGMRVKLNLAFALSHRAELLLLDEPTSGLDPISRGELTDIFTYLKSLGVTVFFSTHVTSDLERCADRILYIQKGRLAADAPLDRFIADNAAAGRGDTLEEIMLNAERKHYDA